MTYRLVHPVKDLCTINRPSTVFMFNNHSHIFDWHSGVALVLTQCFKNQEHHTHSTLFRVTDGSSVSKTTGSGRDASPDVTLPSPSGMKSILMNHWKPNHGNGLKFDSLITVIGCVWWGDEHWLETQNGVTVEGDRFRSWWDTLQERLVVSNRHTR